MSQHVVESADSSRKWVFGWDQPLQSFFLQVHQLDAPEDEQIVVWLGTGPQDQMYEVEDLVAACDRHDLALAPSHQRELYLDKDEGR